VASFRARGVRPAFAAVAAAAAGILVTVAGCSSSSSSSAAASASASPSATASASPTGTAAAGAFPTTAQTPQPAASGQLTGDQLASALPPASDFPAGYATSTSGPVTSGSSLTEGVANYNLATMTCATFVEHLGSTGFGETAMASGSVSASGTAFDELVYQFSAPAKVSSFVSGIESLAQRCASFKLTSNGQTGSLAITTSAGPSVGGHATVDLSETGKISSESVNLDLLLSADGVDAFGVAAVGAGKSAPTTPTRETILYSLMKRQMAAAELS
jgi:hypothetical protein